MGFALNRGARKCPNRLEYVWEYWDWQSERWVMDPLAKVTCATPGGPTNPPQSTPGTGTTAAYELCVSGPICDDCTHTAGYNGVTYCCSTGCNSGWIEIDDTQSPLCKCGH